LAGGASSADYSHASTIFQESGSACTTSRLLPGRRSTKMSPLFHYHLDGSPSTAMTSASLPSSMVPMSRSILSARRIPGRRQDRVHRGHAEALGKTRHYRGAARPSAVPRGADITHQASLRRAKKSFRTLRICACARVPTARLRARSAQGFKPPFPCSMAGWASANAVGFFVFISRFCIRTPGARATVVRSAAW
jgi:hypothetical protein